MEEGSLHPAPVWFGDFTKFPAAKFRGLVDCIVAGFPCQDLSLAGKRAGLDGARSGLFFDILDIADACGARGLFLENVAGISSATASVVDEAEGDLEERAAARVLGELADRGWHAEWLTLSASDVGASHGRARWFCWAWRSMGNSGLQHQHLQQRHEGSEHQATGDALVDSERVQSEQHARQSARPGETQGSGSSSEFAGCGWPLGHATQFGRREGWTEPGREQGRPDAAEHGGAVADSGCSDARRIEHIAGPGWRAPEHHVGGAAVADAGLQGLPLAECNELCGERGGG